MKKQKKEKKPDRITVRDFFVCQGKIFRELFTLAPFKTVILLLLSTTTALIEALDLYLLSYVTDGAVKLLSDKSDAVVSEFLWSAGFLMLGVLVLTLLNNLYRTQQTAYTMHISMLSNKRQVEKLASVRYEYFENNQFHNKINLAARAPTQYPKALWVVTRMVHIAVMLVVYTLTLSEIHFSYILIIALAVTVGVFLSGKMIELQIHYYDTHTLPDSRRSWYYDGLLSDRIHQQNIQVSRSAPFFRDRMVHYRERMRKNSVKDVLYSLSTELFSLALFLVTFVLTALMIGRGVALGEFTVGYYTMVIAMLANLFRTVKQFVWFVMDNNWYVKVLNAHYDVLACEEGEAVAPCGDCEVHMEGIRYRYPQSDKEALKGVSLTFRPGEKIAIVGHNGSGKTTLVSILLSLLRNTDGTLTGTEMEKTAVMQDFIQHQLTIKENIEIGCGGAVKPDEFIWDIIRKVGLEEFVRSKPDGIYTMCGQLDQGIELSKGQWQRIAIGRLLANPAARIWILDEPTAYLDPLAEIEMYNLIYSLAGDRMVFFISHRLGFAKNADRIIVLKDGIAAEQGTHKSLMEAGGIYAEMFSAQKEWYR
ncbi:MAG: ABC transporter ATP-binding protein [Clostridia bacterium]|nr:ABC transporter ATP-binding protein [Clostridia bacterium]